MLDRVRIHSPIYGSPYHAPYYRTPTHSLSSGFGRAIVHGAGWAIGRRLVAGIPLGLLVLIVVIVAVVALVRRRRRRYY